MSDNSGMTQGEPYRAYRGTLLSPKRVRELTVLRPWRAIADALGCWLCIASAWTAVALWPTFWVAALAILIIGTRYYGLFLIGHDGLHRRVLATPRANDLFCDLFIFGPIGAITRINNVNHLTHHRLLSTAGDPDRHKHACFNKTTRGEYLLFLTGVAALFPAVRNVFLGHPERPDGAQQAVQGKRYGLRDIAILGAWQAALMGGLTWMVGWWGYPVLWLLPTYVFCYSADLIRSFVEHSQPENDGRADTHRLITFSSTRIERLFFAPMNMNYHTAHHLWPSIPYYNLPAADREIKGKPEAEGLIWRSSYVGYLLRYLRALPLPECRP